jgi:hypothetical protein
MMPPAAKGLHPAIVPRPGDTEYLSAPPQTTVPQFTEWLGMSNPVTPYLLPGLLFLLVFAAVVIAAHRWDTRRKRDH